MLDLAEAVQTEVDAQLKRVSNKVEFEWIQDRPYNDLRYLIDISKAKSDLSWEPKISFEDGNFFIHITQLPLNLAGFFAKFKQIYLWKVQ